MLTLNSNKLEQGNNKRDSSTKGQKHAHKGIIPIYHYFHLFTSMQPPQ